MRYVGGEPPAVGLRLVVSLVCQRWGDRPMSVPSDCTIAAWCVSVVEVTPRQPADKLNSTALSCPQGAIYCRRKSRGTVRLSWKRSTRVGLGVQRGRLPLIHREASNRPARVTMPRCVLPPVAAIYGDNIGCLIAAPSRSVAGNSRRSMALARAVRVLIA